VSTWFASHRVAWIVETLSIFGFINRAHVMRKFDVSEAQAAKDLRDVLQQYPGLMTYDTTEKRYVSTAWNWPFLKTKKPRE